MCTKVFCLPDNSNFYRSYHHLLLKEVHQIPQLTQIISMSDPQTICIAEVPDSIPLLSRYPKLFLESFVSSSLQLFLHHLHHLMI